MVTHVFAYDPVIKYYTISMFILGDDFCTTTWHNSGKTGENLIEKTVVVYVVNAGQ